MTYGFLFPKRVYSDWALDAKNEMACLLGLTGSDECLFSTAAGADQKTFDLTYINRNLRSTTRSAIC